MLTKIIFLIVFFAVMIAVGLYSRKHATNVNDFVLGGRAVGPWLTAFAYGTSYFSAVVFVGYADGTSESTPSSIPVPARRIGTNASVLPEIIFAFVF